MRGIDKVLLISSPDHSKIYQHHKNVIDAAVHTGVKQLAYTGFAIKDASKSPLILRH